MQERQWDGVKEETVEGANQERNFRSANEEGEREEQKKQSEQTYQHIRLLHQLPQYLLPLRHLEVEPQTSLASVDLQEVGRFGREGVPVFGAELRFLHGRGRERREGGDVTTQGRRKIQRKRSRKRTA